MPIPPVLGIGRGNNLGVGRELRSASLHELKERLPGRRQLTLAVFYHGIEELSLDAG
jgi:hypothetical protein